MRFGLQFSPSECRKIYKEMGSELEYWAKALFIHAGFVKAASCISRWEQYWVLSRVLIFSLTIESVNNLFAVAKYRYTDALLAPDIFLAENKTKRILTKSFRNLNRNLILEPPKQDGIFVQPFFPSSILSSVDNQFTPFPKPTVQNKCPSSVRKLRKTKNFLVNDRWARALSQIIDGPLIFDLCLIFHEIHEQAFPFVSDFPMVIYLFPPS